jgi:hypothetical protein
MNYLNELWRDACDNQRKKGPIYGIILFPIGISSLFGRVRASRGRYGLLHIYSRPLLGVLFSITSYLTAKKLQSHNHRLYNNITHQHSEKIYLYMAQDIRCACRNVDRITKIFCPV